MEKVLNKNDKEISEKSKNSFNVLRLIQYFIIYSVIGLIIEMLFGVIIEGVVESRKNFLYGPFSCIYGTGAVLMILTLQRFSKNKYTLFLGRSYSRYIFRIWYKFIWRNDI